jgi:hypothetical protein
VPIPPQLARQLQARLREREAERLDAFLFPNTDGGRIDLSNFSRDVWNDARRDVLPAGSPLRTASTLLDTYLGVMRHDEALGRARIEQAFGSTD